MAAMARANASTFQTNDTPGYERCVKPATVEAASHGFVGLVCTAGGGDGVGAGAKAEAEAEGEV